MDMTTAPKDGTRILIKMHTWGYDSKLGHQTRTGGTEISECWFHNDEWQLWCGNERTSSTGYVDPIAWAPVPAELV